MATQFEDAVIRIRVDGVEAAQQADRIEKARAAIGLPAAGKPAPARAPREQRSRPPVGPRPEGGHSDPGGSQDAGPEDQHLWDEIQKLRREIGLFRSALAGGFAGRLGGLVSSRGGRKILGAATAVGVAGLLIQNLAVIRPIVKEILQDTPEFIQDLVDKVLASIEREIGGKIDTISQVLSTTTETAGEALEMARNLSLMGFAPNAEFVQEFWTDSYKWNLMQQKMRRFGAKEAQRMFGDMIGKALRRGVRGQ